MAIEDSEAARSTFTSFLNVLQLRLMTQLHSALREITLTDIALPTKLTGNQFTFVEFLKYRNPFFSCSFDHGKISDKLKSRFCIEHWVVA
jgi:hypothetical protein